MLSFTIEQALIPQKPEIYRRRETAPQAQEDPTTDQIQRRRQKLALQQQRSTRLAEVVADDRAGLSRLRKKSRPAGWPHRISVNNITRYAQLRLIPT